MPNQWIEVDLGRTCELTEVVLTMSQTKRSPSSHEFFVSEVPMANNVTQARLAYRIDGVTEDREVVRVRIPPESGAVGHYLQIRTTKTYGWVSWREIAIYGFDPMKAARFRLGRNSRTRPERPST